MRSCFFVGHRDASEEIFDELADVIKRLVVEKEVTEFLVGNYGNFDRLAMRAVVKAKEMNPKIKLSVLLPYHPAERMPTIIDGVDDTFYPPDMENIPRRLAIVRANKYAIDHADYLVVYAWQPGSNAKKLFEYAKKRENRNLISIMELTLTSKSSH